ncbi:MAG: penicillin-binding protein 2 [Alphaproteobacteria bacterium RIFCSPHIGHO2_12_FULL_63_12]|nr:MAG: penicillin-binding protein 2 [Alphaproteobacteria bacterium RIFCSPHIGHO2_12_FULL_63_12]
MRVNSNDPEKKEVVTRRAAVFGGGFGLLLAGVGARLFQLQVLDHEKYQRLAQENQFNTRIIAPLRGEIVDRFGKILASNRQNFRLLLMPDEAGDIEAALDRIRKFVVIPDDKHAKLLREIKRTQGYAPVEIVNNLGWDDFSKINYELPHLPGAHPEVSETRNYPLGNATAFMIGYVGAVTERDLEAPENENQQLLLRQPGFKVGRDGLERTYEKELRGVAGSMDVQVNAHGRVIEEIEDSIKQPTQGETLGLTIDADLQLAAMKALEGESASAVVIDIETGDILVLASTPAFDPNIFTKGIPTDLWRELNESPYKPLLNKPLGGVYPPGSTFKMITAIAAQRAGVDPSFSVHCNGKFWHGNRFFHCWKKEGHGRVDMKNAIKHSCDVFFYTMGTKLDIDQIAAVASELGLGEMFELGIPGMRNGIVPSRDWKRAHYAGTPENQIWFPGETLSVAIGQGATTATPLQLAVMTARIASGKEVRPRIVRFRGDLELPTPHAPHLDLNEEYLQIARAGMNAVVNEPGGTAVRSAFDNKEWKLAGKTGTAQVYRITDEERRRGLTKGEDLPWSRRDHALFVCFAPYEAPRYACAVVVEHGIGGAKYAGPKAKEIMTAVMTKDPARLKAMTPGALAQNASRAREG